MKSTQIPEKKPNDSVKITFSDKRKKFETLFESNQLKNAIEEFYLKQKEFHKNMSNIVHAFNKVKDKLPEKKQNLLNELLRPYRVLIRNPFHGPTGDVERDTLHIIQVISEQNNQFKEALSALLDVASNVETFNQFLQDCQQDQHLSSEIKQQLDCSSWLTVQSCVDHPFQNLMRYEILLKAIEKYLPEEKFSPEENFLEKISRSLDYLVTEVKNINENREVILLLNRIERMLGNLLAEEIIQHDESKETIPGEFNQRRKIEFTMLCLKVGKTKIIQGDQDILSLYRGLLDLLNDIKENHAAKEDEKKDASLITATASYVAATGYYLLSLPATLFAHKNNLLNSMTPLAELQAVIKELKETIDQTEALKNIQEKLLKNIPM